MESPPLRLVQVCCPLCSADDAEVVGRGEDFEYRTGPDTFQMTRCRHCGLLYLNPRPDESELARIYPSTYHAFDFSPKAFGFVYRVRRRLEARRVLSWCKNLPDDARIIDVGCGDGFHLKLLREFGQPGWRLEGIDLHPLAIDAARRDGLTVHAGRVEDLDLPRASYDLALTVMTVEHVADPPAFLAAVKDLLKPGGRVVVVTDNAGSIDAGLFGRRHWGGYHFPRHWSLFTKRTLAQLASKVGLEVERLATQVSPVNWVYSIRNRLADRHASRRLVEFFSLKSALPLAAFTVLDNVLNVFGRGAVLRATLRRPLSDRVS